MADISTPSAATPVSDAVLRVIGRQLRKLELAGQLTPNFEVRCSRDGSRVKHCNVLLLSQDFAVIPEDTVSPR